MTATSTMKTIIRLDENGKVVYGVGLKAKDAVFISETEYSDYESCIIIRPEYAALLARDLLEVAGPKPVVSVVTPPTDEEFEKSLESPHDLRWSHHDRD